MSKMHKLTLVDNNKRNKRVHITVINIELIFCLENIFQKGSECQHCTANM